MKANLYVTGDGLRVVEDDTKVNNKLSTGVSEIRMKSSFGNSNGTFCYSRD